MDKVKESVLKYYYETGVETPEIFGSGSQYSYIVRTADERMAFEAYKRCGRNYLTRQYLSGDGRLVREYYDGGRWKKYGEH